MGLSGGEGILIALIGMLFFGGKKLPEFGKSLGKSVRSFKDGLHGTEEENAETKKEDDTNKKT